MTDGGQESEKLANENRAVHGGHQRFELIGAVKAQSTVQSRRCQSNKRPNIVNGSPCITTRPYRSFASRLCFHRAGTELHRRRHNVT
jgi:hypothetical protein